MEYKPVVLTEELSREIIDRLADAGATAIGIHPGGGRRADEILRENLRLFGTDGFRELVEYAGDRGLKVVYEIHAWSYLLPRELFAEHPEYFRMDGEGRRTPEGNFCVGNPEALRIVAENAARLAGELPGSAPEYYFWPDDVAGADCRCPSCRELSPSDKQLRVVNAVARRLRKDNPAAEVAYIAYNDCFAPPVAEAPEEGVFLEYAPMSRGLDRPAREMSEEFRANLDALLELFGSENARLLEYWYDNSYYSGWKLPPRKFGVDEGSVVRDIDFYGRLGFRSFGTFYCYLGADYRALYGTPPAFPPGNGDNRRLPGKIPS